MTGLKTFILDNGSLRLGIGKDFQLNEKWSLQSNVGMDWIRSINETQSDPPATGLNFV